MTDSGLVPNPESLRGVGAPLGACGGGDDESSDSDDKGDGDGDSGDTKCAALCDTADYASGDEMSFDGNITECICSGDGREITQAECSAYCDNFSVPEAYSYLSTSSSMNDKCVCDGTQL